MLHNNKHITIIITRNTNKQINSQLIDPGNEQWRRKGGTLSTHQLSCHAQYTWDRLSDCTISPQAYCTVLHKHIHLHCTNCGGNSALTLSSIMTRSLGSVRSIFRTLCLVCAWLLPTKKYLWKETLNNECTVSWNVSGADYYKGLQSVYVHSEDNQITCCDCIISILVFNTRVFSWVLRPVYTSV